MTRVSTGIPGLDQMIGGGFLHGDSILVAGSPGTGKTTTGLHFVAAGAQVGEASVYVTFEYLPQQLYRDAKARGWDLRGWEKEGLVKILCTTPDLLLAELEDGSTILQDAVRAVDAKRLVIDSMTHFEFIGRDAAELRQDLAGLMNQLRLMDVTSLVTHEIPQIIGPAVKVSEWGLEFLVDAVILFRYVELDSELVKAVNVMKFRGADHDRRFQRLHLDGAGIHIEDGFAGVENISGGNARRSFKQRAKGLI